MKYYVNKNAQSNGYHEVHTHRCVYKPNHENCQYLGEFSRCQDAVKEADKFYEYVDGCFWCSNPCHKH